MKYEISKELFEAVMSNSYNEVRVEKYTIRGYIKQRNYDDIYINDFFFKCKEWAFKQGYELHSRIMSNDHIGIGNCLVIRVESDPEDIKKIINAKTEQQAVFNACQWILDNKE